MGKLSIGHYLRNLKLVERNKEWLLASRVSKKDKTAYYSHILKSYATGAKKIKYLGNDFYFDNPATPLNLQNYPYELSEKILKNMYIMPKTVLDIGANIGQFSLTANYVLGGEVKIDSFEPNPFVFNILEKNVVACKNVAIHNYGIGSKKETTKIYYDPRRTGIGSLIKQNAGVGATESSTITISNEAEKITGRKTYDLIKIDVEGYEFSALKGLDGISTKYLFIEVSGVGRVKDYKHSEILGLIAKTWGNYDICYMGSYEKGNETFDLLVKFIK